MALQIKPHEIIKTLTLFDSAAAAGAALYITYQLVPAVKLAPVEVAIKQWNYIYTCGAKLFPGITALTSASYCYLGYATGNQLYYVAAGVGMLIGPFTLAIMKKTTLEPLTTINKKVEASVEVSEAEKSSFTDLVDKWNRQHLIRALFMSAAAGLGLFATFTRV